MSAPERKPTTAGLKARSLAAWPPAAERELTVEPDSTAEQAPAVAMPESTAWAERAATLLAQRPPAPDQSGLIAALPPELDAHVQRLRESPDGRRMFEEGWQPALVTDLRRVIAAQRTVLTDSRYTQADAPSDMLALAQLTLPLTRPDAEVPVQFDSARQLWTITSPNPNLRITGRFGGKLSQGQLGFGFLVEVLASFVSVASYHGRLVLRDGYHRAHWLLGAGIVAVPAFIRELPDGEQLFNRKMLPEPVWMGDRPPLLADFDDDGLSREILIPEVRTTLYVSAVPTSLALDNQS